MRHPRHFTAERLGRAACVVSVTLIGVLGAGGCGDSDASRGPSAGAAGALGGQSGAASSNEAGSSNLASGGSGGTGEVAGASDGGAGASGVGSGSGGAASARGGSSSGGTAGAATAGSAGATGNAAANAGGSGTAGSPSLPPHTGNWRITPLGDSITGTTCGPQLLSKALIDHGKSNFTFVGGNLNNQSCNGAPNVQTEGHGGYLVTDLVGTGVHASELPKWCESDKAEIVLMQFGTNDVWNDRSPSAILAAYSTVLDDLRAANPNVILLVAQITPLNPSGCSACESRVVALNSQIPGWASSKSSSASPVFVVDLHSAFTAASYTPNSTYTADGVHPNVAGGQLIADKWYAALAALGVP